MALGGGINYVGIRKKPHVSRVRIANPDPAMAKLIITQLGGPDGELGAAMRYLTQRFAQPYARAKQF